MNICFTQNTVNLYSFWTNTFVEENLGPLNYLVTLLILLGINQQRINLNTLMALQMLKFSHFLRIFFFCSDRVPCKYSS
jgi:hypothetical protein